MKAGRLTLLFVLVLMPVLLHAQWPKYPTAGVPKTAAGTPNLSAPAPKTSDGKPDLSGVWEMERTKPCPPDGCTDGRVGYQFLDIGWGVPGGLPYQPWAADLVKKRSERNGMDDPASRCMPSGPMKLQTAVFRRKLVQTPGLLLILSERDATYRQVFTDGRPRPVDPDLPSFNGYSSGKWEGDTLVIVTTGFTDGLWLDRAGSPLTDAAKMTEKFRRVNYGKLEVEVTVEDPKAYTKPWTVKLNQVIVLDKELLDTFCMENEKDMSVLSGK